MICELDRVVVTKPFLKKGYKINVKFKPLFLLGFVLNDLGL